MKNKLYIILMILIPFLSSSMFYYEPEEFKLADVKVKNGKYDEALKLYEKLAKKYSNRGDFQYNWGIIYYKSGKYKEAIDHYRLSLTSEKNKVEEDIVLYNLGVLFEKTKKYNEAIEMYKEALLKNPKNMRAKHNLELLLKHSKKGNKGNKNKNNSSKNNKSKKQKNSSNKEKKENKKKKDKEKEMILRSLQNKKEKFLPMNNQKAGDENIEKDW